MEHKIEELKLLEGFELKDVEVTKGQKKETDKFGTKVTFENYLMLTFGKNDITATVTITPEMEIFNIDWSNE